MEHIQEEMRCFVVSVCYRACEWITRSSAHSHSSDDLTDGLRAYSYRQAVILAHHATNACHIWGALHTSSLLLPPAISAILSELDRSSDQLGGPKNEVDGHGSNSLGVD